MTEQPYEIKADDPILNAYFSELLDEEIAHPWEITDAAGSGAKKALQPAQADCGQGRYWLFPVAGLRLAVPEDRVFTCVPAPNAAVRQKGGSSRCFEATVDGGQLLVVDSLELMDPEHQQGDGVRLPASVSFLVRLDTGNLAITAEAEPVLEEVDRDAVCWRGARGSRAWLAGTLRSQSCVIVDVDGLHTLVGE